MLSNILVFITLFLYCLVSTKSIELQAPNFRGTLCSGEGNITCVLNSLTSNTTVILTNDTFFLLKPVLIEGIENVTITSPYPLLATLVCSKNSGLALAGVRNLLLERVSFVKCGLSSNSINLLSLLHGTPPVQLLNTVKFGVILAECINVTLSHVRIMATRGVGLLGLSIHGDVSITDSLFINNTSPACEDASNSLSAIDSSLHVGGGAFFVYYDLMLSGMIVDRAIVNFKNNLFVSNRGCSDNGLVALFAKQSSSLQRRGYVAGEGALALVVSEVTYPLSVQIDSCNFTRNFGKTGGALQLLTFAGVNNLRFIARNCVFQLNGFDDRTIQECGRENDESLGGAVAILLKMPLIVNGSIQVPMPSSASRNVFITIETSEFITNAARAGGGVYLFAFPSQLTAHSDAVNVLLDRCTFTGNRAMQGGALFATDTKSTQADLGILLVLSNTNIIKTLVNHYQHGQCIKSLDSGAVHIHSINLTFTGQSRIQSTDGSGAHAINSMINNNGTLSIHGNVAFAGGGLKLIEHSTLILKPNSTTSFTDNRAMVQGGAIYVDYFTKGSLNFLPESSCILYFGVQDIVSSRDGCLVIDDLNIKLIMQNTTAPVGNLVYGSNLEACSWSGCLIEQSGRNKSVYEVLTEKGILVSDIVDVREAFVSSFERLNVLNSTDQVYSAFPGETLKFEMKVEDERGRSIPTLLVSPDVIVNKLNRGTMLGGTSGAASLGGSTHYLIQGENYTGVPLFMTGMEFENFTAEVVTMDSKSQTSIRIMLSQCPVGFVHDNYTNTCKCSTALLNANIQCSISQKQIVIPDNFWVGPLNETASNADYLYNNFVAEECIMDYCQPGVRYVSGGSWMNQCHSGYNRDGLLCGECRTNYSTVLGSNRCLMCSNWSILLLLTMLLLLPAFNIVVFLWLDVTISHGFLNGILFYASIVELYIVDIIPRQHRISIYFPLTFINNHVTGIEMCLYNGMTPLYRELISLIWPVYLGLLMLGLYLAVRYIQRFNKHVSMVIKAMTTLTIICYLTVLQWCYQVLAVTQISTLDGTQFVRWIVSPSVVYFSGLHGVLVTIAVLLLLFYIIPLPIFLLSPARLYRTRRLSQFKPFYDAFWNPFKPKLRFWLGLRLLLRLLGFLFVILIQNGSTRVFLINLVLFLLLLVQIAVTPFEGKWQNVSDLFFLSNLIFLFLGVQFFNTKAIEINNGIITQFMIHVIYSSSVIALAYVAMCAIVIYHVFLKWPNLTKSINKCRLLQIRRKTSSLSELKNNYEITVIKVSGNTTTSTEGTMSSTANQTIGSEIQTNETSLTIEKQSAIPVNYTVLREPMLDCAEAEIETSYRELSSNNLQ